MRWLQLFRIGVFAWITLCAIIVLGLGAHVTYLSQTYLGGYFTYAALGIATAVLTLVTLPVMFIVDLVVSSVVFTSWILIEIIWLSIMWVLWLATAGEATSSTNGCQYIIDHINDPNLVSGCRESQALEAFAFLAWLPLMAYSVTLLVLSSISAYHGSGVWLSSVAEGDFVTSDTKTNVPVAGQYQMEAVPAGAAPVQPYQTGPTQQYPANAPPGQYDPYQATPAAMNQV